MQIYIFNGTYVNKYQSYFTDKYFLFQVISWRFQTSIKEAIDETEDHEHQGAIISDNQLSELSNNYPTKLSYVLTVSK